MYRLHGDATGGKGKFGGNRALTRSTGTARRQEAGAPIVYEHHQVSHFAVKSTS